MTKLYLAQICTCVFESGFETISIHMSKKAAYIACRKRWLTLWNDWNDRISNCDYKLNSDFKKFGLNSNKRRRRDHDVALANHAWRVQTVESENDTTEAFSLVWRDTRVERKTELDSAI